MARPHSNPEANLAGRIGLAVRCVGFAVLAVGLSNLLLVPVIQDSWMPLLQDGIASTSGSILSAIGLEARVKGVLVLMEGGAVRVTNVCSGLDMWICLASAIIVVRASPRDKVMGIFVSFVAVSAINLLRVVGLASVVGRYPDVFEWTHYYFWPGVILAACLAILIVFMQRVARQGPGSTAQLQLE